MAEHENDVRENDVRDTTPTPTRDIGRGAGGFLTGVILGAVLGAGLALLLAPEAGPDTRRRLGRQLRSLKKDVRHKRRRLADRLRV